MLHARQHLLLGMTCSETGTQLRHASLLAFLHAGAARSGGSQRRPATAAREGGGSHLQFA
jgi:hypothetical protein